MSQISAIKSWRSSCCGRLIASPLPVSALGGCSSPHLRCITQLRLELKRSRSLPLYGQIVLSWWSTDGCTDSGDFFSHELFSLPATSRSASSSTRPTAQRLQIRRRLPASCNSHTAALHPTPLIHSHLGPFKGNPACGSRNYHSRCGQNIYVFSPTPPSLQISYIGHQHSAIFARDWTRLLPLCYNYMPQSEYMVEFVLEINLQLHQTIKAGQTLNTCRRAAGVVRGLPLQTLLSSDVFHKKAKVNPPKRSLVENV